MRWIVPQSGFTCQARTYPPQHQQLRPICDRFYWRIQELDLNYRKCFVMVKLNRPSRSQIKRRVQSAEVLRRVLKALKRDPKLYADFRKARSPAVRG